MTITFQIASDLHIEYKQNEIPEPTEFITPEAEILILPGDIGSLYKIEQLSGFLLKVCQMFKIVLYVPGNHEWYHIEPYSQLSMNALEIRMQKLEQSIDNLFVLNRNSVIINDVCIAGATLWSDPKCKVPPFIVRIPEMKTNFYKKLHKKDLKYIESMIDYCQEKNIKLLVVSHHPPTNEVLKYYSNKKNPFVSLYSTNLDYLLTKNKVNMWICGHTHKNFNFTTKNGTRVISNQKGKIKDNIRDFNKKFIISL